MENNKSSVNSLNPKINIGNVEFNLKILIEKESILVLLEPEDSEIPFKYQFESTYEKMGKINKIFQVFNSLEEIKEFLLEFGTKKENIKLLEINEEEEIAIEIKYNIGKIVKIIKLDLLKIILDDKKMIKYLTNLVNYYKSKNEIINNEYDSKLITNIEQIDLIKKGIDIENSKNLKLKLLFRASRDGDTIKAFHDKVDGISPTISIIQIKDNNYIFGGYTDHAWDSKSGCVRTNNTFMFSFNTNLIYRPKDYPKNGGMIHCSNDYGPGFCKGAGVYLDNYFSTNNCYIQNLSENLFNFTKENEISGGLSKFSIKEVEVFQVE